MGEQPNVSGGMNLISANLGSLSPEQIAPSAKAWIGFQRENIRPWTTFINTNNFRAPSSLPRLSKRIVKNIEYFQSNYLFVFVGLVIYCLLTSPLLLLAVGLSFTVGCILTKTQNERRFVFFGQELTLKQQYGLLAICSIPLYMWAGAGAAVFWVMGSSFLIIQMRASEMYTSYKRTVGLALIGFIIVLRTVFIDFLFLFCLYYIGASLFIVTLHAAFYNIEAIVKLEDSFGLLEEV